MTAFEKVLVTPDTPEWEAERRHSVGASEVAAIMGLSPYATALDVYKAKVAGIDRPFPAELAFYGHASEQIIHRWVEEFSGLDVTLQPGFMARSVEHPYLHASFDRVSEKPWTTWQFKTSSAYTGHEWNEGIPTAVRVQVQAEMAVAGTSRAAVVVWIGGRETRIFWEPRDDKFIDEYLVPAVRDFWDRHVRAQVPPPPMSVAEVNAIPTDGSEIELSEEAFEALERITVLNSDIKAQEDERDALKVALGQYVGTADVLTHAGRKVATWKQQKGRAHFDQKALREVHPEIAAEFTVTGAPFRVLRTTKLSEVKQ